MKELLDKIASYNLFNYLLPGVLFTVIINWITKYTIPLDNLVVGAFISYFIGLIISRIGSLIIEPLLKKSKFLKFANYGDYISASKNDPFIETLSEVNNMYRTLLSMIMTICIIKIYELISNIYLSIQDFTPYLILLMLLILFLFSYKKQTSYIFKRITLKK